MKRRCIRITRSLLAGTLLIVLLPQGCRTTPGNGPPASPPDEPAEQALNLPGTDVPKVRQLEEAPLLVDDIAPERSDHVEEERVFPRREIRAEPQVEIGEYPENLIRGIKDPDETVNVVLNLDATALTEIVPLFAELLNFSYHVDPEVSGAVTMQVDSEMTAREAWQMFEHILWLAGAYASKNPGFIHILPFSKMPRERRLLAAHDPMANVEVAFIPIRYVKSSEIINEVKPFLTEGAMLTDIPRDNTLLIVEAPANMPKIHELIKRLDTKGEAAWPHITLRCREIDAETVVEELKSLLPILGLPVTDKAPSGGKIKLTAVPRLQVIVASAAMKEVLDEVERWCRVLDSTDKTEQENIFFYNVHHATAEQLAEAIGVFFNTSATRSGRPSTTKSTSAKSTPAGSGQTPPAPSRIQSSRTSEEKGVRETVFDTPVVMYVDEIHTRLMIRTTPRAYAMVEALLKRLDVPPGQVLIQALIAEITLNETTEFGFSYAARQKYGDYFVKSAMVNSTVVDPAGLTGAQNPGLAVLLKQSDDKLAFLKAVAGETNVRVLSAPQIVAANDEEAVINVGDRVPIITGDYTDVSGATTTDGSVYRNVQYQDTGIILTVTPHITAGNEVRVDIKQEVSDAKKTEVSTIDSPTIQNRLLETSLIIPDGGTVLLGGLIETQRENSYDGLPLLMKIPYLGHLFRTNRFVDNRNELLVLVTANVIDSATTVDVIAKRYGAALEEINRQLPE